jgi:hemolysin activation/secretion protein
VRGLNDRVFANDNGNVMNFEVYTPDLAQRFKLGDNVRLRFLAFYDYGHVSRNEGNPVDGLETQRLTVAGSGVGLRLVLGGSLSLRLDGGFAATPSMSNAVTQTTLKQFRMHGALNYVF